MPLIIFLSLGAVIAGVLSVSAGIGEYRESNRQETVAPAIKGKTIAQALQLAERADTQQGNTAISGFDLSQSSVVTSWHAQHLSVGTANPGIDATRTRWVCFAMPVQRRDWSMMKKADRLLDARASALSATCGDTADADIFLGGSPKEVKTAALTLWYPLVDEKKGGGPADSPMQPVDITHCQSVTPQGNRWNCQGFGYVTPDWCKAKRKGKNRDLFTCKLPNKTVCESIDGSMECSAP